MARFGISMLVCAMLACVIISAPSATGITCGQVVASVSPCINYLRTGGAVPPACCSGVQGVNSAAKTTPDRQTACGCLKNAARNIPGLQPGLLAGLPGKCRVFLPYTVSPNIDCSKVK